MDLHRCPICGAGYGFREVAEHCCDGLDNGQRRRVTRMRARIAKLEAALRELVDNCGRCTGAGWIIEVSTGNELPCPDCGKARALLEDNDA